MPCVFVSALVNAGSFQHDLFDGEGDQKFANGDRYKGTFKNGAMEGQGKPTVG